MVDKFGPFACVRMELLRLIVNFHLSPQHLGPFGSNATTTDDVLGDELGTFVLVGHALPLVGHALSLVGHALPLVGHALPLVGHAFPLATDSRLLPGCAVLHARLPSSM